MSDPRYTDPRLNDPIRPDLPPSQRMSELEESNAMWGWIAGGVWLALTVAFEFSFGRAVLGRSWNTLLAAYSFAGGNLWPAVLCVIALAPALAARARGWK